MVVAQSKVTFSEHVSFAPMSDVTSVVSNPTSVISNSTPPVSVLHAPQPPAQKPSSYAATTKTTIQNILTVLMAIMFGICVIYILSRIIKISRTMNSFREELKTTAMKFPPTQVLNQHVDRNKDLKHKNDNDNDDHDDDHDENIINLVEATFLTSFPDSQLTGVFVTEVILPQPRLFSNTKSTMHIEEIEENENDEAQTSTNDKGSVSAKKEGVVHVADQVLTQENVGNVGNDISTDNIDNIENVENVVNVVIENIDTEKVDTVDDVMNDISTDTIENDVNDAKTENVDTKNVDIENVDTENVVKEDNVVYGIITENVDIENVDTENIDTEKVDTVDDGVNDISTGTIENDVNDAKTENVDTENGDTEKVDTVGTVGTVGTVDDVVNDIITDITKNVCTAADDGQGEDSSDCNGYNFVSEIVTQGIAPLTCILQTMQQEMQIDDVPAVTEAKTRRRRVKAVQNEEGDHLPTRVRKPRAPPKSRQTDDPHTLVLSL